VNNGIGSSNKAAVVWRLGRMKTREGALKEKKMKKKQQQNNWAVS